MDERYFFLNIRIRNGKQKIFNIRSLRFLRALNHFFISFWFATPSGRGVFTQTTWWLALFWRNFLKVYPINIEGTRNMLAGIIWPPVDIILQNFHYILAYILAVPANFVLRDNVPILGEWLYNVTNGVGRVYSVSKSSVCCSKVCGNDCQCGVKPLSATNCLMKWGTLQLPVLSPNILQC